MDSTQATAPPARSASQSASAFAYRDFRIYWIGSYAAFLGQRLNVVALSILVFDLTGSPLRLGLVAAANAIPIIIFNIVGGVVADRMETRLLLRLTAIATTMLLAMLAVLVVTHVIEVWHVFVLAVLSGIAIGFDTPARQAYFPSLVPPRATRSAVTLNGAMMASASVVMPTIGGLVISFFGTAAGFFIAATGYGLMTLSTWLLPRRKAIVEKGRKAFGDFLDGVSYIVRNRVFAVLIGLGFANMLFVFGYIQVLPAFASVFGGSDELIDRRVGFIFSAAGAGALLGTIFSGRIRPGRRLGWAILGAAFFFSTFILLAAHSPDFYLVLVFVAIGHFGNGLFMTASMAALQLRVPDELRGRVMGVYAINQSLAILGGLWAGTMADVTTVRWGVAVGPVVLMALITLIALTQREVTGLTDDVDERKTGKRYAD